ncbi:MAG: DUF6115 domain-containing protein [bacterium]
MSAWTAIALGLLFTAVNASVMLYFQAKIRRESNKVQTREYRDEIAKIQGMVADLITDLNHVANANINVLEGRTEELKRAIAEASQKMVKMNSLMADAEIVMKRLRESLEEHLPNPSPPPPAPPQGEDDNAGTARYRRIYEMYNAGMDPSDIAQEVKMGVAEVRLILGLKEKEKSLIAE